MITIDYSGVNYIINVPKAYTQFVETDPTTGLEIRQMNLTTFAQDVGDLQDDPDGAWAVTAYEYTAPKAVGGVQLAPVVLVLDPYIVEFEDGQYAVNLQGANTNVQDVAVVNQVSIRANNSAGLTYSDEVQILAYQNASVWIDTIDGLAGTQYPRGTVGNRVNNLTDAVTIANRIRFNKIQLEGSLSFTGVPNLARYQITGNTPTSADITATNMGVGSAAFERVSISGSITGRGSFTDCILGNLTGVQGIFNECALSGNVTLDSLASEPIIFKDNISSIAGAAKPGVNCNSTAAGINFRRYTGGLAITNFSNAAGTMSLDLIGAEVSLDSNNCTAGDIVARGVGRLIDENGDTIPYGIQTWNGISIKNLLVTEESVDLIKELHQLQGLDDTSPLTVTPTARTVGAISQTISGDGENVTVVTRN